MTNFRHEADALKLAQLPLAQLHGKAAGVIDAFVEAFSWNTLVEPTLKVVAVLSEDAG